MRTVVFIDAANLFYGGRKSLGWSVDYQKLHAYLVRRYQATHFYYFGGVDIHHFPFDYIANHTVPIHNLERYLAEIIAEKTGTQDNENIALLTRHHSRVRFYKKLESFGYTLILKPVKTHTDAEGNQLRKANCDVDMTLYMATEKDSLDRAIVLTGDGDFLPALKHLRKHGKEVLVLSRGSRTAREIRHFAGEHFTDFEYLRELLKQNEA